MSDSQLGFRTVMRGYDPGEVDERIAELTAAAAAAQQHARELHSQVETLSAGNGVHQNGAKPSTAPPEPDFASLGVHIGGILKAAQDAAINMGKDADDAVAEKSKAHELKLRQMRADAERDAAKVEADAKVATERLLHSARQQADAIKEAAELAHRQQVAQDEKLKQQMAEKLAHASEQAAQLEAEATRLRDEARKEGAANLADAKQKAGQTVAAAQKKADEITTAGREELAAANKERDNAISQLTSLYQGLASVVGGAAPASVNGDAKAVKSE